jgi:DNA-binding transcriptional MerR regulator/methylmalonyl-CoA mutase cobalamin-binding subunit
MSAGLNIAALARRTGVAPDTLRKWEQRYQILAPSRTAGGQRRYSERDVARVEWLRERLGEGYRIGEAASLLGTVGVEPAQSARDHLHAMLESLDRGEAADVGLRVDQAFALVGVDETLAEILCPLLESCDRLSIAEEHLVSEAVRSRLGYLLADAGGGLRGIAVLACAPGERHELGVMMAAIALRQDGWKVVYLGADTPLEAAFALARRLSARLLGLSLALAERAEALAHARPPEGVTLVLGGAGASRALAHRFGAVHAGPDLHGAVEAMRVFSA